MMKNKHNYESTLCSRRECLLYEQILTYGRNPGLEENEDVAGECFSLRYSPLILGYTSKTCNVISSIVSNAVI